MVNISLYATCNLCEKGLISMTSNYVSSPTYLKSALELVARYDTFILDVSGVLYDEEAAFPGVLNMINTLREAKKRLIIFSNSPRPNSVVEQRLVQKGFPGELEIFTSGDIARALIKSTYGDAAVYHLGKERNQDLLNDLPVTETPHLEKADFILVTLFTEEHEDPFSYETELKKIVQCGQPIICANPDIRAMNGLKIRRTAGFYAKWLEDLGADVLYTGKPKKEAYEYLWHFSGLTDKEKARSVMVGDTLETDIHGANVFGIKSHLVLTGNTGREARQEKLDPLDYINLRSQENMAFMPTSYGASFSA